MPVKLNLYCILVAALALCSACTSESIYEGVYTWGAEVETFSPCGTGGKAWWVITDEVLSHQLSSAHGNLTTKPYEGIYVRVSGFYDGPPNEAAGAFAAQYEGLFRINKVLFIGKRSALDCKR